MKIIVGALCKEDVLTEAMALKFSNGLVLRTSGNMIFGGAKETMRQFKEVLYELVAEGIELEESPKVQEMYGVELT